MKTTLQKIIFTATLLTIIGWSNLANAQWVQSLLLDEYIRAVTSNGPNMFAVTNNYGAGIYKSSDNGATWNTSNQLSGNDFNALVIKGTAIFAGTFGGTGIYKSANNGTTWTASNTGLTNKSVTCLAADNNNIYAGTIKGVFLSTDNGATWTAKNTGIETTRINTILIIGSDIFIGTVGKGVMLSSDGGTTWTDKNNGASLSSYGDVPSLGWNGTKIFRGSNSTSVVLSSSDNGNSWAYSSSGIPLTVTIQDFETSGSTIFAISSNAKVFQSSDDGNSWSDISTGLGATTGGTLHINGSNIFATTTGKGIWKRPLSQLLTNIEKNTSAFNVDFKIYPNPSSGKFTLELPTGSYQLLTIYNYLGETIYHLPFTIHNSSFIDISNQPSGIYFVQIKNGEKINIQKIVKE